MQSRGLLVIPRLFRAGGRAGALRELMLIIPGTTLSCVMPGLVPAIHEKWRDGGSWMAGTSPAMTGMWCEFHKGRKSGIVAVAEEKILVLHSRRKI